MHKAKLVGIAPKLIVQDVKRTAEYYRDVLGFTIIAIVGEVPVYAMAERDGFQVHFAKADKSAAVTIQRAATDWFDFIIWVPEIELMLEEFTAKHVTIVQGIVKRSYGSREFIIEDCDGHRILIGD